MIFHSLFYVEVSYMEKEKKFMIIGVFILLITLVGAAGTYAWFTWSSTTNTNLTMSIGASSDVIFNNIL